MRGAQKPIANYFITGFTACGKTSVGQLLARHLDLRFVDLDDMLQARAGRPIPVLFNEIGEERYRILEASLLRELVQESGQVIALGAGTITFQPSMELVRAHGLMIFLDTDLDVVYRRVRYSEKRFLFRLPGESDVPDEEELLLRIRTLYEIRKPYYQTADIRIGLSEQTPEQVVQEILFALQNFGLHVERTE